MSSIELFGPWDRLKVKKILYYNLKYEINSKLQKKKLII